MSLVLGLYNYWIAIGLMMLGLYAVIGRTNLVKRVIGLGIFQTGIFLLYISMGKVEGGTAHVYYEHWKGVYSNSIPTALILTGIVVAVATMAVALALVVCIKREYGTIEADEIEAADEE